MKRTLAIFIVVSVIFMIGCSSNLTAETTGQVKSAVIDRDTKTVKKKTSSGKTKKKTSSSVETEIEYTYSVNGNSFDGYSEKDGDVVRNFQSGAAVVVCYDPKNPSQSDVFPAGTKCGS